jgi:S1-C subfamily serine protease
MNIFLRLLKSFSYFFISLSVLAGVYSAYQKPTAQAFSRSNFANIRGLILAGEQTQSEELAASDLFLLAENYKPAVVAISAYRNYPLEEWDFGARWRFLPDEILTEPVQTSTGSGFFISSSGFILTNKHVVADELAGYAVSFDGETEVDAQVLYRDPTTDLAIVKIAGQDFPALSLDLENPVDLGDQVVSIGNALGEFTDSVSSGRVLGLSGKVYIGTDPETAVVMQDLIETTARLYPGDSGGPLLNERGEVVGVNTAISLGKGWTSYFISSDQVQDVLDRSGLSFK